MHMEHFPGVLDSLEALKISLDTCIQKQNGKKLSSAYGSEKKILELQKEKQNSVVLCYCLVTSRGEEMLPF